MGGPAMMRRKRVGAVRKRGVRMVSRGRWPKSVKLEIPDRARIEENMKAYSRVVRREKPPSERAKFSLSESDRLKIIS
jgi:hypothetical protein